MASHLALVGCCCCFFLVATAIALNINDYGAIPDGITDSTQALQKAWAEACAAESNAAVVVPAGQYVIGPVMFKGPCKSPVAIQLDGTLLAHPDLRLYRPNWIEFQYIDGLVLSGAGKVDGRGSAAWGSNKCRQNHISNCRTFPMNMVFSFVNDATISGISSIDSKYFHVLVFGSQNVTFDSVTVAAPGDSPNTDGIHVAVSQNVAITNSVIGTGDDCISIGDHTVNLTVSGIACGPGHGISVGSLGRNPGEQDVVGLAVRNCTFNGTMNGVRIKTWQNGPKDLAVRDLVFEDLTMNAVENPIVIDQKYCPSGTCPETLKPSRVRISNVTFHNIKGTSETMTAINLVCSQTFPCEAVQLSDIDLKYAGSDANATCINVKATVAGDVNPAAFCR
ncbi:galacturan 1,4-alpha-galacturonidase [Apostasia shenzhenica]|uniref:Exopolygalacturonase n=1 Tax=Apostasia shenzhenica TaxID=1088818 RepID=A0A2I0B3N0_9ASPA|nr:galacturan 1,4-alpha-galacturonidase [Apostasia shenzhenica]